MRSHAVVAALFVFALLASPAFAALTVQPDTQAQSVWVGQGAETTFQAFLTASQSADRDIVIKAEVEANSGVSVVFPFGKQEFVVPGPGTFPLPLLFKAAGDAKLATTTVKVKAGDQLLYTIEASVVLPPEEIVRLQDRARTGEQLAAFNDQLTAQVDALTTQLTDLQANVQTSLDKALVAQSQVTTLSAEKASLQAQLDSANAQLAEAKAERDRLSAENKNLAVTGNIIGGASPVTFGIGLLIGAAALYLLFGRRWGWVHRAKPEQAPRPL